jgi:hypothetical protein
VLVVHRLSIFLALKQLAILTAIYTVLMAPWWWHNYQAYGQFVRLNLGGGIVLYSGNYVGNVDGGGVNFNIDVPGYYDIRDPVERDRVLKREAMKFIAENPQRFIELAGLKLVRLWQPWPHAVEYSGALIAVISAASYLPLLVLAMIGAGWCARHNPRAVLPIVLLIGFLTAVHMVTIGSLRYRFPMEPFLAILAGAPVAWIARRMLQRQAAAGSGVRS